MERDAEKARLRRDVAWNLVPVVLLAGVGLGLNFLIALWWGAEPLATFNIVTFVMFVFAVLGACGIQYSVLRTIAENPDDRDRVAAVVAGALVPNLVLASLSTAIFVLGRELVGEMQDSQAIAEGMLWAAPGLFCFALNKVLFGVVNGLRRMRAFAVYTSLRYVLIATGLAVAKVTHVDANHLPVIWSFAEGVLLLVLIGELLASVSLSRSAGWTVYAKQHLDYGARGVVATLAFEINSKLDVWMLGAAGIAKAQVGIYSLASVLYEGSQQLSIVLQNNLNPVIARDLALGRKAEVVALARQTRRWFVPLMAAAAVLGAAAYPYVIPWLVGNPEFTDGALPFAVMMAGVALASAYLPFNQVLLMANRPGWHTVLVVLVMAINYAGNLVLIPQLGLVGAAAAAAISLVGSALLVRFMARLRVELPL